jgi:KUP system potassium uptake protein
VWFLTLAGLGILHTFDQPAIFRAIDPSMAVRFIIEHGFGSLGVMAQYFSPELEQRPSTPT